MLLRILVVVSGIMCMLFGVVLRFDVWWLLFLGMVSVLVCCMCILLRLCRLIVRLFVLLSEWLVMNIIRWLDFLF